MIPGLEMIPLQKGRNGVDSIKVTSNLRGAILVKKINVCEVQVCIL